MVPILSATLIYQFGRGIIIPILPLYLFQILHFSALQIGLGYTALGVGTLVFEPLWGMLADARSKVAVYVVGISTPVSYLSLTFLHSWTAVVVLQFFMGGLFAGMAVVQRSFVARSTDPPKRSGALGVLGSAVSGSVMVGSLTGGVLDVIFGARAPFYFGCILAFLSLFPLAASGGAPRTGKGQGKEQMKWNSQWGQFVLLGIVAMTAFMGETIYMSLIGVVMTQPPFFGSAIDVSIMVAIFNFSRMIFQPVIGSLGATRARLWVAIGLLLGIFAFIPLIEAKQLLIVYASSFVEGLAFSSISPLSMSMFVGLTANAYAGTAIGIYGAAEDIGVLMGPLTFGLFWAAYGIPAACMSISAVYATVLVLYVAGTRKRGG